MANKISGPKLVECNACEGSGLDFAREGWSANASNGVLAVDQDSKSALTPMAFTFGASLYAGFYSKIVACTAIN